MNKLIFILVILLILVLSCVSLKKEESEKNVVVSENSETPKTKEEASNKQSEVVNELNSVKENLKAMEDLLSK